MSPRSTLKSWGSSSRLVLAQEAPDAGHARVAAELVHRLGQLVGRDHLGDALLGVVAHGAELEDPERPARRGRRAAGGRERGRVSPGARSRRSRASAGPAGSGRRPRSTKSNTRLSAIVDDGRVPGAVLDHRHLGDVAQAHGGAEHGAHRRHHAELDAGGAAGVDHPRERALVELGRGDASRARCRSRRSGTPGPPCSGPPARSGPRPWPLVRAVDLGGVDQRQVMPGLQRQLARHGVGQLARAQHQRALGRHGLAPDARARRSAAANALISAVRYIVAAPGTVTVSSGSARMKNSVPATDSVTQWKMSVASSLVRCQILGWSVSYRPSTLASTAQRGETTSAQSGSVVPSTSAEAPTASSRQRTSAMNSRRRLMASLRGPDALRESAGQIWTAERLPVPGW